jgi:UDP-glucose:(heptosyl)LPS alpha-1,3-glucosyltransferase
MSLYAFCLYKYFPFGGLQRDFLRIASLCHERGHQIRVYTLRWQGEIPNFIDLRLVPVHALQNHVLRRRFRRWVAADLQKYPVDAVIGFDIMQGLDFYYAAAPCFIAKTKGTLPWYQRFNPRFQQFYKDEKVIFTPEAKTKILLLSQQQKFEFQSFYHTPEMRLHILPPGIAADRVRPPDADSVGKALRLEFAIKNDDIVLLMVGSGFKTKGLDRSLLALAALPPAVRERCQLIVIGQDKANAFIRMSRRLNIIDRVRILPGRNDIPRFLFAADLLLHPAYIENTGTILLEALVAGLPVLVSDVCGYAPYIADSGCGALLASPFQQADFNVLLLKAIEDKNLRQHWQTAGLAYAKTADLFSLAEKAVDIIEKK